MGFPGSLDGKAPTYNAGDPGSIAGSGRSPGEGNGNPLQYSCLENPMDWGAWWAWWATIHGVAKSWTRLSDLCVCVCVCVCVLVVQCSHYQFLKRFTTKDLMLKYYFACQISHDDPHFYFIKVQFSILKAIM